MATFELAASATSETTTPAPSHASPSLVLACDQRMPVPDAEGEHREQREEADDPGAQPDPQILLVHEAAGLGDQETVVRALEQSLRRAAPSRARRSDGRECARSAIRFS